MTEASYKRSETTLWSSLFAKKWKVFSAFQRSSIQTVKAQSQIRPRPLRVSLQHQLEQQALVAAAAACADARLLLLRCVS